MSATKHGSRCLRATVWRRKTRMPVSEEAKSQACADSPRSRWTSVSSGLESFSVLPGDGQACCLVLDSLDKVHRVDAGKGKIRCRVRPRRRTWYLCNLTCCSPLDLGPELVIQPAIGSATLVAVSVNKVAGRSAGITLQKSRRSLSPSQVETPSALGRYSSQQRASICNMCPWPSSLHNDGSLSSVQLVRLACDLSMLATTWTLNHTL